MASTTLPYGLRDVKVAPIVNGVVGTLVDLPNARTLSFEEAEDYEELRGDDRVVATRGKGASVNWDLEGGGISLPAYVVMNGGTLVTTGVAPATKDTYSKKSTDSRPEFLARGQALSESGGDFHTSLFRCKASGGLSGEMADGAFWLTSASGVALGRAADDVIYEFTSNATVTAIA